MTLKAVISHRPANTPEHPETIENLEHVTEPIPEHNEHVDKEEIPPVSFRRLFRLGSWALHFLLYFHALTWMLCSTADRWDALMIVIGTIAALGNGRDGHKQEVSPGEGSCVGG